MCICNCFFSLYFLTVLLHQLRIKVHIFDLQYADDTAIPSHTAAGLQRSLVLIAATYQRAGLTVNIKKTETIFPSPLRSHNHYPQPRSIPMLIHAANPIPTPRPLI